MQALKQFFSESDSFEDVRIHETITFKSLDKLLSKYLSDAIQSQWHNAILILMVRLSK